MSYLKRVKNKSSLLALLAFICILVIHLINSVNEKPYPTHDSTGTASSSTLLPIHKLDDNLNNSSEYSLQVDPPSEQCLQFDHGDISPFPKLDSIFNCNSPTGNCQWFYPAKFLNDTCGIGKKFHSAINYMEKRRITRDLWVKAPPFILQRVSLHPGIKPYGIPPGRTVPLPTHNVTMVRVHKTGSSSLVKAFNRLVMKYDAEGQRMISYLPRKDDKGVNSTRILKARPLYENRAETGEFLDRAVKYRREWERVNSTRILKARKKRAAPLIENRAETGEFLDRAVKYRREWEETDHTLFAVVRDPAERFISAIGQATGGKGSSKNGVAKQLVDECVKTTEGETLRCFVDLIMRNGTWIEVHFTPMVFEISFATMNKDIPIAVFPFESVGDLLYELNSVPTLKLKNGKAAGYRVSEVLTNITVQDYDDETLHKLCKIYEVDVLFLRHIGYPSMCDSCLPANIR